MNENLDLTKILEGCPVGTEFYHVVYGRVWFVCIDLDDTDYPIRLSLHDDSFVNTTLTKKGTFSKDYNGECLLYPSKDQRDWSKFERFWDKPKIERFDPKTLEPYDRVLVRDATSRCWKIDFYGYNTNPYVGLINCASGSKPYCIPYNEETKHLLGTTDDCPEHYKWWEE